MLAVEVAREIEEVRLEAEVGAAHGGSRAEIRDTVVPAAGRVLLNLDPDRVDAARGAEVIAELDVRGRETDGAAALIAHVDAAFDLEGSAQEGRRLARLASR